MYLVDWKYSCQHFNWKRPKTNCLIKWKRLKYIFFSRREWFQAHENYFCPIFSCKNAVDWELDIRNQAVKSGIPYVLISRKTEIILKNSDFRPIRIPMPVKTSAVIQLETLLLVQNIWLWRSWMLWSRLLRRKKIVRVSVKNTSENRFSQPRLNEIVTFLLFSFSLELTKQTII